MLRKLEANRPEFTPITFAAGVNIIVAERDPDAAETDSRNAKGKTSILHAINFCLGSNVPASFRPLATDDWSFSLTLDVLGNTAVITRGLKKASRVFVNVGKTGRNPIWDEFLDDDNSVSIVDWKFILGLGLFGLDEPSVSGSKSLSARTLLSYVVRIEAPKDPLKILAQQPAWSSRQHVAYLLGLDWRFTRDLALMEKEESAYAAIKFASETSLLPAVVPNESDLMIQRNYAEERLQRLRGRVDGFVVIDDPNNVVREADEIGEQIRELRNQSVVDTRMLDLYTSSLDGNDDEQSGLALVRDLYEEMGRAFSSDTLVSFDKLAIFHQTVTNNRRTFLADEVSSIARRQREREEELTRLGERRSELLARLEAGGALDELVALQAQIAAAEAKLDEIERALDAVRQLSTVQEELAVRRAQKRQDARRELDADRAHLDRVAARFDSMMRELYNINAVLTVEIDDLAYKFRIYVPGSASTGVTRMQLFCFDMTLMAEDNRARHPDFLIHDSAVFDGVDPRQVTAALHLAKRVAHETSGQYIMTMNSNDVPDAIKTTDWYDNSVRRTILDTEKGGAMGVEF